MNYGEVLGKKSLLGKYFEPLYFVNPPSYLNTLYEKKILMNLALKYSESQRKKNNLQPHIKHPDGLSGVGIKDFYLAFKNSKLLGYLEQNPDIRLITLLRENPLERYISEIVKKESGIVRKTTLSKNKTDIFTTIVLNNKTILKDLDAIQKENDALLDLANTHKGPRYNITYENYFSSDEARRKIILEEMFNFLGVENITTITEHRKLQKVPHRDLISNFDEITRILQNSRYKQFLT